MVKLGTKMSKEFCKNQSEYMKKHPLRYWLGKKRGKETKEWKNKISNSLKGKEKSDKHKSNISKSRIGNKNPSWIGGRKKVTSGHILIYKPEHPNSNTNGNVFEHRLVMEDNIKRLLTKDEIVHHIDCDPSNNSIENLYLTDRSGHQKIHNSMGKLLKELLKDKIIVFNNDKGIYEKR